MGIVSGTQAVVWCSQFGVSVTLGAHTSELGGNVFIT